MVWGLILRRNGQPLVIGIEVCHRTLHDLAGINDYYDFPGVGSNRWLATTPRPVFSARYFICPDFMRDHFIDFSGISTKVSASRILQVFVPQPVN